MAKKKAASSADRAPRIGTYTPAKMLSLEKEVAMRSAELRALAKAMEKQGIESMDIDGHSGVRSALMKIDKFIGHATRVLITRQSRTGIWDEPS